MSLRNIPYREWLMLPLLTILFTEGCGDNMPSNSEMLYEGVVIRPTLKGPDGTIYEGRALMLDLDEDGRQDVHFRPDGMTSDDEPPSAGYEFFEIMPLGLHQLLSPRSESLCFALDRGTAINDVTDSSRVWSSHPLTLCSSSWTLTGGWKPWTSCMKNGESQYAGIRMETESGVRFGWIELRIDLLSYSPMLQVVDYGVAAEGETGGYAGE